ncbi:MAG: hypothetical protein OK454_08410, partial [Thaumarchaeota archaeon]|nr:hypothetical protein [Nitrososphaerota archaeon]
SVYGFRGAEPPKRMADTYRLNRDFAYGSLADWLRTGGEIPPDAKLEGELLAMRWVPSLSNKQVLIPKSDLREKLKRSPDRADALALSVVAERPKGRPANDTTPAPQPVAPAPKTPQYSAPGRGIPSEAYGLVRVRRRR